MVKRGANALGRRARSKGVGVEVEQLNGGRVRPAKQDLVHEVQKPRVMLVTPQCRKPHLPIDSRLVGSRAPWRAVCCARHIPKGDLHPPIAAFTAFSEWMALEHNHWDLNHHRRQAAPATLLRHARDEPGSNAGHAAEEAVAV